MGRGGEKREKTGAGQVISWTEIEKHVSYDDRWIVINGQVYDVTEWSRKHPGGHKLLGHYAGQDATVCNNVLVPSYKMLTKSKVSKLFLFSKQ